MSVIVTGSIATDYIMKYPGRFLEHILPEQGKISVSFLVEDKQMSRGGIGPNIAYTMALLGQRPRLMGTVGQDFGDYRAWLEQQGIDTSLVVAYPGEFTATFTVITDLELNQIAGFHAGAMSRGRELTYRGLDERRSTTSSSRRTIPRGCSATAPSAASWASASSSIPASSSRASTGSRCWRAWSAPTR